jgi:hypothetical protein
MGKGYISLFFEESNYSLIQSSKDYNPIIEAKNQI